MKAPLLALAIAVGATAAFGQGTGPIERPRPEVEPREPRREKKQEPIKPPAGVHASQTSATDIVLTWQPVPGAKEYRLFISPPIGTQAANAPIVLPANRTLHGIRVHESVRDGVPFHAWIEAAAPDGTRSPKVPFPVFAYRKPAAPGGGGPVSTPNPSTSGQRCPPGQYMVGLEASGKIVCEALR